MVNGVRLPHAHALVAKAETVTQRIAERKQLELISLLAELALEIGAPTLASIRTTIKSLPDGTSSVKGENANCDAIAGASSACGALCDHRATVATPHARPPQAKSSSARHTGRPSTHAGSLI